MRVQAKSVNRIAKGRMGSTSRFEVTHVKTRTFRTMPEGEKWTGGSHCVESNEAKQKNNDVQAASALSRRSTSVRRTPRLRLWHCTRIGVAALDVAIEKGLLTISGGGKPAQADAGDGDSVRMYARERFMGTFRRAIELPQNDKV